MSNEVRLVQSKTQKASKEHTCDLCGTKINVGDLYVNDRLDHKGKLYDFKSHTYCDYLGQRFYDEINELDIKNRSLCKENYLNWINIVCLKYNLASIYTDITTKVLTVFDFIEENYDYDFAGNVANIVYRIGD